MSRADTRSATQKAMDRIAAMTEAKQFLPEAHESRTQHEQFATYSRVAEVSGEFGHVIRD